MASMKVAFVVLMCMVVMDTHIAQGTIICEDIVRNFAPCVPYLQSGGNPSIFCCSGVQIVVVKAQTTADRQTACKCLKSAAAKIPGYVDKNAASLPSKCHVNVPYKLSTSTNCADIKY